MSTTNEKYREDLTAYLLELGILEVLSHFFAHLETVRTNGRSQNRSNVRGITAILGRHQFHGLL